MRSCPRPNRNLRSVAVVIRACHLLTGRWNRTHGVGSAASTEVCEEILCSLLSHARASNASALRLPTARAVVQIIEKRAPPPSCFERQTFSD